jgi:lysozyme family protein
MTWLIAMEYLEIALLKEEFEDTKGVIIIRKSKKNRQHKDNKKIQKDKQRFTNIYIL